jgi:hypothetical protein
MAQADPDFDWTTAQLVEEDDTSATLAATTFGQRSMPVPTQGPVNVDTEFDWKTATLVDEEPFDPTTARPFSDEEERQFYQGLEVASRDPQRILTNTEHSLLYDHRQQQDNAVQRFFEGAEDIPGNLVGIAVDAGGEIRQNYKENLFRPDRFAARNIATGMEVGRKVGVQLLQLFDWGQNKVADTIQRGRANDAKMREIAAAIPKTGDPKVDGDNVMAAIAKARDEGVFAETPFGPDKETDYERYLRQNSYARTHAGNITEATMGGKTMGFPEEQMTFMGEKPMQSVATGGAMGLDFTNALPLGVGVFSKLRVLRRLSRVTGMPLPAVERGLAGAADKMEDFGSRVAARVTDRTGLSKTQQVASLAAVSGGAGLLAANTDGMDGVLLPVAAVSGIVPLYKAVGGTIRKTSQAAGTGAMVLREMRAGNIGVVRQAAADDLLRTGAVPKQYADYMRPYANGVESTLGRMAKNPDNPEITRKLARLADRSGVTQAVRFADDAVSSGIAATLASTPFALLAPDAEQAGAIVGGAATLGTFAGPIAGAVGRRSSRVDADIARMLIDVHAVNGDVPALISLGRDRLGQIAGMQGVVAGKTDFVTLRASDYRANVDVRATGNETGAGVFIEKASNGTARIFINVGEPASMDGKVRVRDRGDGVREVRVRGNDGRTEFIAAPKGRRLLVNDGDTVKAGQQVVDYMPPSRSVPHEIAHAILTSDILDGDIRTDMRNYVTQVYGEDGIKARGREYMAQIVDGDIMFGTHEGAVALTPEEIADVRSGKRTMSDVMKGKPVEAAERDALIDARIDEYNQRSREKGGNDYDWARDEVTAEQFAGEAKGIDFRGIRAGGPKVLESALATSARVLEVLGAKFDRTTGKPLDNPSVLFRDNPLFQSPVLRKRMIEHVRAYNDLLAGLEDAGKRETRGTKVSVDGTPDSAARSPHTKMRPDPDKGGQVGNEFLYVDETGKTQWRSPSEVRAREGSRTTQAKTLYNPSRILAANSTEFGLRRTDSGRTIVSGPTLPAQFDHFVHFPKWMREFARVLEASRERGMTFIADYNAIGDGKDGTYRVRNRGDIRAIQREVAFVGWEMTANKHLKTVLMDLNAFRAAAMKAINNGELGIFNNDMQVIEADLRTYLGNHRNGLPGEAGIGQAKRDMLNGLIGTGTAVQRKANPLFSDLNPRGSVRSFRLDRYNDLTPTGREGLSFDYDKINNNRMPQQIPREAQGMPDAVETLTTDQLLRQYEENQGYLGLSTLGMREGRPVRGGAAQTRELLRRNEAISAELERRGVRSEDAQLQRALQRRGQAMPDVADAGDQGVAMPRGTVTQLTNTARKALPRLPRGASNVPKVVVQVQRQGKPKMVKTIAGEKLVPGEMKKPKDIVVDGGDSKNWNGYTGEYRMPLPNIKLDKTKGVSWSKQDIYDVAQTDRARAQANAQQSVQAAAMAAADPMKFVDPVGYSEIMRASGVAGDILIPPSGLKLMLTDPTAFVGLLDGGFHGKRTVPGTRAAAMQGLDGVTEMRQLVGGQPSSLNTALHHFWGTLSKQLDVINQEAAWMRLMLDPAIIEAIDQSTSGKFSMQIEDWEALVAKALDSTQGDFRGKGNNAKSNANSFYNALVYHNGRWDEVAALYANNNAIDMRAQFNALGHGKVGMKNKVQGFVGLSFGVKGSVLDRWRFVDLYLPDVMKLTGAATPEQYFKYVGASKVIPQDPIGIYKNYGTIENDSPAFSLALYNSLDSVAQVAINNSPELRNYLGAHADPGGLHWVTWNSIKNEAVGHSSLDITKNFVRKYGRNGTASDFAQFMRTAEGFVEGSNDAGQTIRLSLKNGVFNYLEQ